MNARHSSHLRKTLTLHDAGGWYLIPIIFGIPVVGVVLDYFWNFLVLFLSLKWLRISASTGQKFIYCAIVPGGGLVIDIVYYAIVWGVFEFDLWRGHPDSARWGTGPVLEFITILIPIAFIIALNYAVSRLYLHVNSKQAVILGAIMGLFTAPWLIALHVIFLS